MSAVPRNWFRCVPLDPGERLSPPIARTGDDFVRLLPTDGVISGRLSAGFGIDGPEPLPRLGARPEFQKCEAGLARWRPRPTMR
ncbi:hypothetical protein [Methylobacterium sp. ID0610]|uniref:hypothetical protein n=1 Tax=Methylobacterium carpenticola TaxID=3344827 RepID=UPI0036765E14